MNRIEAGLERPVDQSKRAGERPLHDGILPEHDAAEIKEQNVGGRVLVEPPEPVVLDGLVCEVRGHHRQRRHDRRVRIAMHVVPFGHLPRHHAAADEVRLVVGQP